MKNAILMGLVILAAGCGKSKMKTNTVTQFCTITQQSDNSVLIECPNGTSMTVPPQVVTVTNTITVEVPVIVEVPKDCGDEDSRDHNNTHHDENNND
jgi:hypothetical protein